MTQVQVAIERQDDGSYRSRCYATEDGIDRTYIGCRHLIPKSAIEHSERLVAATRTETDHPSGNSGEWHRRSPSGSPVPGAGPSPAAGRHPADPEPSAVPPAAGGSTLGL